MDKERLKGIFIEEATEIIEKLDVDIINFEESPDDKDLLNELFRGVHTLKGSANSFGFTKLGRFVHTFEDTLDYFRNSQKVPNQHHIDLFLEAVDVIKDVFKCEIDDIDELPENYNKCVEGLSEILGDNSASSSSKQAQEIISAVNLADEFGDSLSEDDLENFKKYEEYLLDGEVLYKITLKFDTDIYIRGQDHSTFFKNLSVEGRVLDSFWDMKNIPKVEDMVDDECYIKDVVIFFASSKPLEEIEDIFEFIDEEEWEILRFDIKDEDSKKDKNSPEKQEDIESKDGNIEREDTKEPQEDEQKDSATKSRAAESKESKKGVKKDEKRSFVKIDTEKLDELFDSVGELVIAQNFLGENIAIKELNDENVNKTIETLSKITRLIQNRVMSLRMVPVKDTFEKMKRVVRDASRKVEKEVKLTIVGEDTEIDKTMVDSLSDPLIHIIRNAVDHGLEQDVEDRVKRGKDRVGNVTLSAYHKGGNIVIEISDDGRGINRDKVLKKAIERGVASEDEEYSDAQIYNFIMQAGFSTADKISDISGRGVGLDVVRSSIEGLRGKVEIESKLNYGSKFCIFLPLTLAIIDGMLVKSSGEVFIIPTLSIVESFRPHKDIVHSAQGKGEFVKLRDEILPIVRLNQVLGLSQDRPEPCESILVCADNEKGRFAILVDELIGRQQVVIKSLGETLSHLKEVSGGAVMGNGEIALILNVEGLY